MAEILLYSMLLTIFVTLLLGYPVAFVLAGVALAFAYLGSLLGAFDLSFLNALPNRIYGIMLNELLLAVPFFIFMGVTLERAKIAEELLETMSAMFGTLRGGLGISVLIVGALLAASTGIVGATVVTMGLISLPTMLKSGYSPRISTGTICAAGTLGQIIPPSIVIILLGDQISSAWQTSQLNHGIMATTPVTIADLFVAALLPGLALVGCYLLWIVLNAIFRPGTLPPLAPEERARIMQGKGFTQVFKVLLPPLLLIAVVLGSILLGFATATESAAVGAIGAMLLALSRKALTLDNLRVITRTTTKVTCMVFTILIGATVFTLVFRGFGGEEVIHHFLSNLPGGLLGAMLVTMLVIFLLGFFLDFIEIIFVVVPIIAPILLGMGADPIWLAVMIAVNLQTSFLTPPFGFALFYLRGVAPAEVKTTDIYRGIIPFVGIQIIMLVLLATYPRMATWLPDAFYGTVITPIAPVTDASGAIITDPLGSAGESWSVDF
jgi:tripartite ATP-independent transporter DctM subunit